MTDVWLSHGMERSLRELAAEIRHQSALLDLARLLQLEPSDPAVVAAFDELVLRGHLRP